MNKFFKILKYIGFLLLGMLVLFVVIVNITPVPISFLVRNLFEHGTSTTPKDYGNYIKKVKTINNLIYPSKYKSNKADLYLPKEGTNPPIIIWVHGGSFVGGDKKDIKEYSALLASSGYAVLSMNYERAPELKYPNQLKQIGEVYDFLLSIASTYNLNINNIFLAGDSAGAHLISQFALIQTSEEYSTKIGISSKIDKEDIKGLLLYCGPFNFEKIGDIQSNFTTFLLSKTAWPYFGTRNWKREYSDIVTIKNHLTSNFPPVFITDGNINSFEEHAKELVEELEKQNIKVSSYFIPQNIITNHEYQFLLDTKSGMRSVELTVKFLDEYSKIQ